MGRFSVEDEENTLKEVLLGIVIWGILCEIVAMIFVDTKLEYTLGIAIGAVCAYAMAYHMLWAIERSIAFGEEYAQKFIRKHSMIRYAVLVVVMAVLMLSKIVNPISWFFALMGLKAAAYMQPLTHRILLGKEGIALEKERNEALMKEYEEKLALEEEEEDNEEENQTSLNC